jgi:hypothetical protein
VNCVVGELSKEACRFAGNHQRRRIGAVVALTGTALAVERTIAHFPGRTRRIGSNPLIAEAGNL